MPVYKWKERATRHFGTVQVPFAAVELTRSDGVFQSVALQIDSGAVISTLRRSIAALLGLELESGRPVDLRGVGGSVSHAFVHEISTRFDPGMILTVPYAVMTSETVPNLLGRLGVFDQAQVHFDVTFHETRLLPPWLDATGCRIWEFLLETEAHIRQRWSSVTLGDPSKSNATAQQLAKDVARRFLDRGCDLPRPDQRSPPRATLPPRKWIASKRGE